MGAKMVDVVVVHHAEQPATISRAAYDKALKQGDLEQLVDQYLDPADMKTFVINKTDGVVTTLALHETTRPSLAAGPVTEALATLIAEAEPVEDCDLCGPGPCSKHLAVHLVEACRAERLLVIPASAEPAILEQLRATVTAS